MHSRSAADEVKRLQNKMYKMYAGTDYDGFISVTDSLKDVALKAGDERAFFKDGDTKFQVNK